SSPPAAPRLPVPFPTRRSSDLSGCWPSASARASGRWSRRGTSKQVPESARTLAAKGRSAGPGIVALLVGPIAIEATKGAGVLGRSEEHTSELQSRENLVCRLLL